MEMSHRLRTIVVEVEEAAASNLLSKDAPPIAATNLLSKDSPPIVEFVALSKDSPPIVLLIFCLSVLTDLLLISGDSEFPSTAG